jgi:hypothetical protein
MCCSVKSFVPIVMAAMAGVVATVRGDDERQGREDREDAGAERHALAPAGVGRASRSASG